MSIIYNGTTLTDIIYNGVSLDKVIYNGVTVFEKVVAPIREPASGEYYVLNDTYWKTTDSPTVSYIYWNSLPLQSIMSTTVTSYTDGIWTYYRGTLKTSKMGAHYSYTNTYGIYRVKN